MSMLFIVVTFTAQALRISMPYAFAALGAVFSERSGVVNIALEGILLNGALATVMGTLFSGSPWVGLACGALGGLATAAVHAFVTVTRRADQIVSGLALNLLAFGLTRVLLRHFFHSASNSPRIDGLPLLFESASSAAGAGTAAGAMTTAGAGAGIASAAAAILGQPLFLIFMACLGAALLFFFHTGLGLAVRSAGEHPEAAHALGFSVARLRWLGVLASGFLGGLGGAWLAFEQHSFTDGMSGGRGFIALAAMIVGKWHPIGAAAACLLFGAAEALQIRLQGSGAPTQLFQALPHVLTIVILVAWVGRAVAPAAIGRPFEKEGS